MNLQRYVTRFSLPSASAAGTSSRAGHRGALVSRALLGGLTSLLLSGSGALALSACGSEPKSDDPKGITEGDDEASGIESAGSTNKSDGSDKSDDPSGGPSPMPDVETPKGKKPDGDDEPDAKKKDLPCEIDFLFVIDHSGSMRSEQENLKNSVPEFIETVQNEIEELDEYHIAVVTTGAVGMMGSDFGNPKCAQLGAMLTKTSGADSSNKSCAPYANGKNFMSNDDDLEDKFVCAAMPGTSGDGNEKPMDAMIAALGKDLDIKDCNAGFLRKDALLVVTIITDEEDDGLGQGSGGGGQTGSKGDPKDWYEALIKVKGGNPKNIVVLGLIGTEDSKDCKPLIGPAEEAGMEGAQISARLQEFVEKFGKNGHIGDVCADSYGEFFKEAVGVIDLACDELPPPA